MQPISCEKKNHSHNRIVWTDHKVHYTVRFVTVIVFAFCGLNRAGDVTTAQCETLALNLVQSISYDKKNRSRNRIVWTDHKVHYTVRFVTVIVFAFCGLNRAGDVTSAQCETLALNLVQSISYDKKNRSRNRIVSTAFYFATTCCSLFNQLRPVHTVRFFLIASAILLIATNGLYRTQWKCSHCTTVTASPPPMQTIVSKKQIAVAIRKNCTVWTNPYDKKNRSRYGTFLNSLYVAVSAAINVLHYSVAPTFPSFRPPSDLPRSVLAPY